MSVNNTGIVRIDQELCTGCRLCADICPVDAIEGVPGQPQIINYERCVLCGQCVQICSAYASIFAAGISSREQKIQERNLLTSVTEPMFATYFTGNAPQIKNVLASKALFTMVQCSPAVRVAIAEEFGMPLGSLTPGKLAAALRKLGFDRIYDTNFAADLTIMEEANELIERIAEGGVLPMFTSCCPAWVKYLEQDYPELTAHLSACKSPQQMAGALFKTYGAQVNGVDPAKVYSVSVTPCTCKKFESDRPEMKDSGYRDVDAVITTRELAQLIKDAGIDFNNLAEGDFDKPLGTYSGAGTIFAASGGVMEAALRTAYELLTRQSIPDLNLSFVRGGEGVRIATVKIGEVELKVAVVAGLKNVAPLLAASKAGWADFHFIEVMTCPNGCVSGGGQPKVLLPCDRTTAYERRTCSAYVHDENSEYRKSHDNPEMQKLYEYFLDDYNSQRLLYTQYTSRKLAEGYSRCS
ncbi:[FeFe] hydrogenase, group A [Sporomusa termitida]|uniref:Iron hydrogenase 1 n=1 Tax=Sporomusa termitida TaxID=2377 RepID=A0A517DYU8_9FIRM|nr:[FeFe] hydrogenase, group A [Sporomusa termitida]QDR82523.1 Iron hydrogenase 1 [Sporomusa termitida]